MNECAQEHFAISPFGLSFPEKHTENKGFHGNT